MRSFVIAFENIEYGIWCNPIACSSHWEALESHDTWLKFVVVGTVLLIFVLHFKSNSPIHCHQFKGIHLGKCKSRLCGNYNNNNNVQLQIYFWYECSINVKIFSFFCIHNGKNIMNGLLCNCFVNFSYNLIQ